MMLMFLITLKVKRQGMIVGVRIIPCLFKRFILTC